MKNNEVTPSHKSCPLGTTLKGKPTSDLCRILPPACLSASFDHGKRGGVPALDREGI